MTATSFIEPGWYLDEKSQLLLEGDGSKDQIWRKEHCGSQYILHLQAPDVESALSVLTSRRHQPYLQ